MPLVRPVSRLGGGRRVEGLGGLGHAGDVGGDHVAGDGRPAVGGRCRPGDGDRGVAEGGRTDRSGAPGVVAGVTGVGRRRLGAGADAVDGGHLEGVGGAVGQAGHRSVVAVELKVWVAWATPAM